MAADPSNSFAVFDGEGNRSIRHHGSKRRYQTLRAQVPAAYGAQHDSVLLIPGKASYEYVEGGVHGSLLRSELSRIQSLERRRGYSERVHQPLWKLCGSLAEVVHHAPQIAAILGAEAHKAEFTQCFSLCGVLAREVGKDLARGDAASLLVGGLSASIGGGPDRSPEVAEAASKALTYVFRYCSAPLLLPLDEEAGKAECPRIRAHYPSLLWSSSAEARALGAMALARLLRRLSPPRKLSQHLRKLLKVVTKTASPTKKPSKQQRLSAADGLTKLLFQICHIKKGFLHSRTESVLAATFKFQEKEMTTDFAGDVVGQLLVATRPGEQIEPLWTSLVAYLTKCLTKNNNMSLAFEMLTIALEYSNARLVTPDTSNYDDDRVVPLKLAMKRANQLNQAVTSALEAEFQGEACITAFVKFCAVVRAARVGSPTLRDLQPEAWLRALIPKVAEDDLILLAEGCEEEDVETAVALFERGAALTEGRSRLTVARAACRLVGDGASPHVADLLKKEILPRLLPEDELLGLALDCCLALKDRLAGTGVLEAISGLVGRLDFLQEEQRELRAKALKALMTTDDIVEAAMAPLIEISTRKVALSCLPTMALAAEVLQKAGTSVGKWEELFEPLSRLLASPSKPTRLVALDLYASLLGEEEEEGVDARSFDAALTPDSKLRWSLRVCAKIESLPVALSAERDMAQILAGVGQLARRSTARLPKKCCELLAQHALGLLTVKFEPLWKSARTLLASLTAAEPKAVWPLLLQSLVSACSNSDDSDEALDAERSHVVMWEAAAACGILAGGADAKDAARCAVEVMAWFVRSVLFETADDMDQRELQTSFSEKQDLNLVVLLPSSVPALSATRAYRRLETMLECFGGARFPGSLPRSDELRCFFEALLSKPKGKIAQLALNCLRPYALPHLKPYADRLANLMDDRTLRETLVNYKVAKKQEDMDFWDDTEKEDSWELAEAHRSSLLPLLLRVLYGRFQAKATGVAGRRKGAALARRATILGFVAALEPAELHYFVIMMARPLLIEGNITEFASLRSEAKAVNALEGVKAQRLAGFVTLTRAVVPRLGFKIEAHLPTFISILLAMTTAKEEDEMGKRERQQATRCLCEILEHFNDSEAIWLCESLPERLDALLAPKLERLMQKKKRTAEEEGQVAASATASLVATLCQHRGSLTPRLASPQCIAALCELAKMKHLPSFEALAALVLDSQSEDGALRSRLLEKQADAAARALASALDRPKLTSRALAALREMASLSERLEAWQLDTELASTLHAIILPRLVVLPSLKRHSSKNNDHDAEQMEAIETCLTALASRLTPDRAASHLDRLTSLMGPQRKPKLALEFFKRHDSADRRRALATAGSQLLIKAAGNDAALTLAAGRLGDLAASDPDYLNEADAERSMRAYSFLSKQETWLELLQHSGAAGPLVAFCASTMRTDDDATRMAAAAALRCFVRTEGETKKKVVETALLPHVVSGLCLKDDATRRGHLSVLGSLVATQREEWFGDLCGPLQDLTDTNKDFFENVAHLQVHRRLKALRQASAVCTIEGSTVSIASACRVLLPLALQPLYEERVMVHDALHREAALTVGAVASRLNWSNYTKIAKRLLALLEPDRQQRAKDEQKKASRDDKTKNFKVISRKAETGFVLALCAVVDNFPFEKVSLEKSDVDKIGSGVRDWLLPKLRGAMTKVTKNGKTGAREEILRPPVALAILRLVTTKLTSNNKRGREEIHSLVVAICSAMKNRDGTRRDLARQTLAKVADFLGPKSLSEVILPELSSALVSGYMLPVRSAALHSIMEKMHSNHQSAASPPGAPLTAADSEAALDASQKYRTDFDGAVGPLAVLLADDLFGEASAAKDSHAANDHAAGSAAGLPEAKKLLTRTYDSLELLAKTLQYRPSYAAAVASSSEDTSRKPEDHSSAHALMKPFIDHLASCASKDDAKVALDSQRCRTALAHIAAGFALNTSATAAELVLHAIALVSTEEEKLKRKQELVVVGEDGDSDDDDSDSDADSDTSEVLDMDEEEEEEEKKNKKKRRREIMNWRPSTSGTSSDAVEARKRRKIKEKANILVQVGAHAPRLTGRNRGAINKTRRSGVEEEHKRNSAAVVEQVRRFAILMLRHALKKHRLEPLRTADEASRQLAGPLLAVLALSYKRVMRDDELRLGVVSLASALLSWRLPTTQRWASRLAKVALSTARKAATSVVGSGGEALQSSLKMLSALLQEKKQDEAADSYKLNLNQAQMRAIACTVRSALAEHSATEAATRSAALQLLVTLVKHTPMVLLPEIYECMDMLAEIHVVSLDRHERKRCSTALLHFALHYPMGKKRRKHHLHQMLSGLDYEYEEGRKASLESLCAAFRKFHVGLLDEYAEPLFVALALRCANETQSSSCSLLLTEATTRLLSRLSPQPFAHLLGRATNWLDEAVAEGSIDDKARRLQLAGARLLTCFARSSNAERLAKHLPSLLEKLAALLRAINQDEDDDDNELRPLAAEAAVVSLEALLFEKNAAAATTALANQREVIPELVLRLLQRHKKSPARLRAAKWFGAYFASTTAFDYLRDTEGASMALARVSCTHLDASDENFDSNLATQASKNLLYVAQNDASLVEWVVDKLSAASCRRGEERRRAVLLWFAAATTGDSLLCKSILDNHLPRVLAPLRSALDDAERSPANTETVALAQELLQHLEDLLGDDHVAQAMSAYSVDRNKKKQKKRAFQAADVVRDPEAAARAKLDKNKAKNLSAKRKNQTLKLNEGRVVNTINKAPRIESSQQDDQL